MNKFINQFKAPLTAALTLGIFSIFFVGCSHVEKSSPLDSVLEKISNADYDALMKKYTRENKEYSGFYNTFQVSATFINSEVQKALLQREAYFMQWTPSQAQSERAKYVQKNSNSTRFFISLYTPKTDYNDMSKANSIWKVYLESHGEKFEGKISKEKRKLIYITNLYPQFTRFHRGYVVEFDTPLNLVENSKVKLVITSSLGNSVFEY